MPACVAFVHDDASGCADLKVTVAAAQAQQPGLEPYGAEHHIAVPTAPACLALLAVTCQAKVFRTGQLLRATNTHVLNAVCPVQGSASLQQLLQVIG
jgi:hypothetical protein